MHNRIVVTIADEKGVKQYNLNKIIKKAAVYALLFVFFAFVAAVGTIYYLNDAISEIERKKAKIETAYNALETKNEALRKRIEKAQAAYESKRTQLEEVSNSLKEIETLIGLRPAKDLSLQERVDLTKLSSENIATMLQFIPNGSPIEYYGITSRYGWRIHPTLKKREFHPGSDMKAKMKTKVYATADGVVEYAGYHKRSGYGKLIIIDHNYGFKTYFGHLYKIKVKAGDFVKKGDIIALTGNSGLSNGPHLHYEVRFIQRPLNPFWFIKWGVHNFNQIFQKEKKVPWRSLIAMIQNIKVLKKAQTQQPSSPSVLHSAAK